MANIYGGGYDNYSTEEQVIGTQVDGKPIYRKTIKINNPRNRTSDYSFNSYNLKNIKTIINKYGVAATDNGTTLVHIPCYFGTYNQSEAYIDIYIRPQESKFVLALGSQYANSTSQIYITFEYTKTTD